MRDLRHRGEELDRLVDLHLQHVADVLAAPAHRQRLGVEALAVADVARHLHVGQEAHLDRAHALPFAGRAAALAGVEARSAPAHSRAPSPRACRRTACGSCPRSRCRSPGRSAASCRSASGRPRARGRSLEPPAVDAVYAALPRRSRPARRALCDELQVGSSTSRASVDLPEPLTPVTATRRRSGTRRRLRRLCSEAPCDRRASRVGSRLARAVATCAGSARRTGRRALQRMDQRVREEAAGHRVGLRRQLGRAAFGDQPAAALAGARADVDDVVGAADRVLVVLDDDQRVALVARALLQRVEQDLVVARVQADRRLVEHVADALQVAAELRREADALRLAAATASARRGRASGSRGRPPRGTRAGS